MPMDNKSETEREFIAPWPVGGLSACSGDILLESLGACVGVTLG
jgi:hypothetical protein